MRIVIAILPTSLYIIMACTSLFAKEVAQPPKYDEQEVAQPPKYDEAVLKKQFDEFIAGLDCLLISKKYPGAVRKLLSGDIPKQKQSFRILAATGEIEAIPWVLPFLESTNRNLRIWAGLAVENLVSSHVLKRRDMSRAEVVLIRPLHTGEEDLRPLAWVVLNMLKKPDDGCTHAYAASMARYLGLYEFEMELEQCLESKHPAVANKAKWAMESLKRQKKYEEEISREATYLQALVEGNSKFSFDLYQKIKSKKGNIFFSPYSLSTALAMTYAGSRGQTEKEMVKVLHFIPGQELLHSSFSELQSNLNTIQDKGHIKLSLANSLWAQEGDKFLDSFLDLNKEYYGAGLHYVDFATKTEAARKTINLWVEDKTQQKIKDLIKPLMIDRLTTLVLCNAIYFKGNWMSQFDKKGTIDADFCITTDEAIQVSMMNQTSKFKLKKFDNFRAIDLPYEGNDVSMVIFLPKEVGGLAEFERNLSNDNVKDWLNKLSNSDKSEVFVSIPKFKTTCEFELSKMLSEMGMPSAFSPSMADFSGMKGTKELFINEVAHKAFVEVNEEGTEATAATAVIMDRKAASKLFIFRADHPFVFVIRENQTGSILFIGRIVNPVEK